MWTQDDSKDLPVKKEEHKLSYFFLLVLVGAFIFKGHSLMLGFLRVEEG